VQVRFIGFKVVFDFYMLKHNHQQYIWQRKPESTPYMGPMQHMHIILCHALYNRRQSDSAHAV
jgi:hypothetical protein